MTYNHCDHCGKYHNISEMKHIERKLLIKSTLTVKVSIFLCKLCMTKAGIKFKVVNGCVE
jgi:hypothetical protein